MNSKRKINGSWKWNLHEDSAPDQILSSPYQTFAQPLSYRRTKARLVECLAQKSRREHFSTLVCEGCSVHNSNWHLMQWKEVCKHDFRRRLRRFCNLLFCPVLRWTYLCKYISYLSAVDVEPWGALIVCDALAHLATHSLIKAMSVSINKNNFWTEWWELLDHSGRMHWITWVVVFTNTEQEKGPLKNFPFDLVLP